jgi:sodium/pantothenate symporter
LLAVVSFILSWEQIQHPALSVAIFAQNGVYAYFAAALFLYLVRVFQAKFLQKWCLLLV